MNNPQVHYPVIDSQTIFKYDNHTNIPWNISEYHTPRLQFDADLQIRKRKYESQKKGEKDKKYVTKRGFFMDYDLKVAKGIPSPHEHGTQKEWDFEKMKKASMKFKIDSKLIKYTYLDQMEIEQKNRKSPGVCAYSLEKSQKEKEAFKQKLKKRKMNEGEKIYYYQNTQSLSDAVPGAGNYCPHLSSPKVIQNKTDYKFWVKKHKDLSDKILIRENAMPAPGTHSPMNMTISTFDRITIENSKPSKKQYFGSDAKFEYMRQAKKKIVEKRPAPSMYQTMIDWKGKEDSPKKQTWNDLVWKGHSHSVYH